ncbi:DUF1694 domain-containing protein [Streptococcus dentasini]
MDNLEKKLRTAASGETRINPDEMRQYLGTFRERILLTVDKNMGNRDDVKTAFPKILASLKSQYSTVKVKSCPNLTQSNQLLYMKMAQEAGVSFTNVNEKGIHPFDLIVHTDKAVNQEETDIFKVFSSYFETKQAAPDASKGFWKRLFK